MKEPKTPEISLTELLLARIAEDESAATAALTRDHWLYEGYGDFGPYVSGAGVETEDSAEGQDVARYLERMNPWRALAECEAKRRLIDRVTHMAEAEDRMGGYADEFLSLLALPYADHPDFREEWRA